MPKPSPEEFHWGGFKVEAYMIHHKKREDKNCKSGLEGENYISYYIKQQKPQET